MIRLGHTPGVAGLSALMLVTGISAELPRVTTESPRGFRITIRHDRPDSAYVQLGSRFPAVVQVGRAGDGTLIARDWVLTAAHVAAGVDPLRATIRAGGATYRIKRRVWHPDWRELGPHDIGLIQLDRGVHGVDPVPLYTARDESKKIAILVGHGDTRTGAGGEWRRDGLRRAAKSRIDSAEPGRLVFTFDAPPRGTELEGAPGRGDSGGPALLVMRENLRRGRELSRI